MKQHLWKIGLGIIAGVTLIVLTFIVLNGFPFSESDRVKAAREEQTINDIFYYGALKQILAVVVPATILLAILMVSYGFVYARILRARVHIAKIGQYSEIPIDHHDLPALSHVLAGLVTAENLKAYSDGQQRAFEMYCQMAEVQTKQIQALVGKQGIHPDKLLPGQGTSDVPALPQQTSIPTFHELLESGEIGPGKPLIFGYRKDTGCPETGKLHELYSTIIIGISGGGKTTFLTYIIGCSVLCEQARFDILDLHVPSPESLGASLGDFVKSPYISLLSNPFDLPEKLQELEEELDRRLATPGATFPPRILVVDEHEAWTKHSQALVDLELRIVNEGRKVRLYLFLTSKSAKADKIGDSALRDNCVTSYVFATKKANARTFFKDEEKVKLLKEIHPPGEAIFTNRRDESCILKLPLATSADMATLFEILERTMGRVSQSAEPLPVHVPQPMTVPLTIDPELDDAFSTMMLNQTGSVHELPSESGEPGQSEHLRLTPERCKIYRERVGWSQAVLAEKAGVSLSKLKRYELNDAQWGADELSRISTVIFSHQPHTAMPGKTPELPTT